MTVKFKDHVGRERQIFKPRRAVADHAAGEITTAELASKPWCFRVQAEGIDQVQSLKTADTAEALKWAKDLCRQSGGDNSKIAATLSGTATRGQITCGAVAAEWTKAGCPDPSDMAGRPREGRHGKDQIRALNKALEYFGTRAVVSITRASQQDYCTHVRARCAKWLGTVNGRRTPVTGLRAAELEIIALKGCLEWGTVRGLIDVNPLRDWKAVRKPEDIINHRLLQPRDGDELHAIARWLWEAGEHTAAALVVFHAMTGLRPGEAAPLRWAHAGMMPGTPGFRWEGAPASLAHLPAAASIKIEWLSVYREKGGANPAVVVHPDLAAFLAAWRAYSETKSATGSVNGQPMFAVAPTMERWLSDDINRAVVALGCPANRFGHTRRTAHSLRAFYVACRRSAGVLDTAIADELGHRTGAEMVVTYGDRSDVRGAGLLTWLPTKGLPAWSLFAPAAVPAVIPFAASAA